MSKKYEILKTEGRAKRAVFHTVHGDIQTPVFMNVGTAAAIKGAVATSDLEEIKCQDIIRQGLRVVDTAAASLCYEQNIPVLIFGLNEENSLMRAVKGEKIGTVVTVG